MNKFSWIRLAALLLPVAVTASCISAKKLEIFQGMEYDVRYESTLPEELRLQPFDRLDIQVLSEIPQLAAPFNSSVNFDESASATAGQQRVSYAVDRDGCIDFPKLGPVNVVGLTSRQLEHFLSTEIKSRGYIKDPAVKVNLQNFEITVIGQRNNIVNVVGGMNLIQLLARTGGPDVQVKMDDVMVIRTQDGIRQAYKVDLRKKEVYDSPVFYLCQNDVVYFKPKYPVPDPAVRTIITSATTLLSGASFVTSILVLLRMSK